MTRTVAHSNLSTPAARGRLKPREKPFWQAIDPGVHLGHRRALVGGQWCVRVYLGGCRYQLTTFAIADDHVAPDGDRVMNYAQAKRRALDLAAAPAPGPLTVAEAMAAYFERRLTSAGQPCTSCPPSAQRPRGGLICRVLDFRRNPLKFRGRQCRRHSGASQPAMKRPAQASPPCYCLRYRCRKEMIGNSPS
jgi:hypothetical protein